LGAWLCKPAMHPAVIRFIPPFGVACDGWSRRSDVGKVRAAARFKPRAAWADSPGLFGGSDH